jgi:hypothetical protein
MFVVCLECFELITQRHPLSETTVIPSVCPACQKLGQLALKRLGLPTPRHRRGIGLRRRPLPTAQAGSNKGRSAKSLIRLIA